MDQETQRFLDSGNELKKDMTHVNDAPLSAGVNYFRQAYYEYIDPKIHERKYPSAKYKNYGFLGNVGDEQAQIITKIGQDAVGKTARTDINTPEVPTVDFGQVTDQLNVIEFGSGYSYTDTEIARASKGVGLNLLNKKADMVNKIIEQDTDRLFLVGAPHLGVKEGLFNSSQVTPFKETSSIADLKGDFEAIYDVFKRNYDKVAEACLDEYLPTEIVMAPKTLRALREFTDAKFSNATYLQRIVEGFNDEFLKNTGVSGSFKITSNWRLEGLGADDSDRMVFMHNAAGSAMDVCNMHLVKQTYPTVPGTADNMKFNVVMRKRIAPTYFMFPKAFLYVDGV